MRCKKSGCANEAQSGPWRKQYCREHGEALLAKHREHERVQASLPDCSQCGREKVMRTKMLDGSVVPVGDLCSHCADVQRELTAEHTKRHQFDNASTVEELKEWMRKYLL